MSVMLTLILVVQMLSALAMIGLILVTHGRLADQFVEAMEHVVGPQEAIVTVCIGPNDDMEQRRADIADAIATVDTGKGVIILTDLFGGTPSNLAISVMNTGRIEVIAGVNLPGRGARFYVDGRFAGSVDEPAFARAFFAMVSSPEAIAGHRFLCSPQMSATALPRVFWEGGPMRVQGEFAALLERRVASGELDIPDTNVAAAQFFTLLKGEPYNQLVFGCCSATPDVEGHLQASVEMFLRAYAPRVDASGD